MHTNYDYLWVHIKRKRWENQQEEVVSDGIYSKILSVSVYLCCMQKSFWFKKTV